MRLPLDEAWLVEGGKCELPRIGWRQCLLARLNQQLEHNDNPVDSAY
jgi:hypothetical protein